MLKVEVGAEVGWNRGHCPRIASRQHDDRHGFPEGLGNAAEGVLRPGAELHGEDPDPFPGGDAADRVGHVQPGPLLTDDDRPDIGRGCRFDDRIHRVPDQIVDPLPLEDLCHRRGNHRHDRCSSPRRGMPLPFTIRRSQDVAAERLHHVVEDLREHRGGKEADRRRPADETRDASSRCSSPVPETMYCVSSV